MRITRPLRRALLVSVVLHFAVLISARNEVPLSVPDSQPKGAVVVARIVPAVGKLPDKQLHGDGMLAPEPEPLAGALGRVVSVPQTQAGHAVFSDSSRSTATGQMTAAAVPAGISEALPLVASAATPPREDVSADGIRQYRLNLAREARRFKHYPPLARQRGWEGVAVVVVNTVAGADLPQATLSQSSGFDALDEEALDLVGQAIRNASLPDSLRGRKFALTLPIHYRLGE